MYKSRIACASVDSNRRRIQTPLGVCKESHPAQAREAIQVSSRAWTFCARGFRVCSLCVWTILCARKLWAPGAFVPAAFVP